MVIFASFHTVATKRESTVARLGEALDSPSQPWITSRPAFPRHLSGAATVVDVAE